MANLISILFFMLIIHSFCCECFTKNETEPNIENRFEPFGVEMGDSITLASGVSKNISLDFGLIWTDATSSSTSIFIANGCLSFVDNANDVNITSKDFYNYTFCAFKPKDAAFYFDQGTIFYRNATIK